MLRYFACLLSMHACRYFSHDISPLPPIRRRSPLPVTPLLWMPCRRQLPVIVTLPLRRWADYFFAAELQRHAG